jgi:hypothetical protein
MQIEANDLQWVRETMAQIELWVPNKGILNMEIIWPPLSGAYFAPDLEKSAQ